MTKVVKWNADDIKRMCEQVDHILASEPDPEPPENMGEIWEYLEAAIEKHGGSVTGHGTSMVSAAFDFDFKLGGRHFKVFVEWDKNGEKLCNHRKRTAQ